jgi:hypothetical protein
LKALRRRPRRLARRRQGHGPEEEVFERRMKEINAAYSLAQATIEKQCEGDESGVGPPQSPIHRTS